MGFESAEDVEAREENNAGYGNGVWNKERERGRAGYEGKQRNIHSLTHQGEGEKNDETNVQTLRDKFHYSQTRGMHTSSAEYTTFITFELINRKSGGKATRITVLRKLRKEEKTKYKKAAQSNDELTCPRERNRG